MLLETNQASLWKAMMSEAGGKEAEGRRESLQLGRWTTGRLRVREILLETYLVEKHSLALAESESTLNRR